MLVAGSPLGDPAPAEWTFLSHAEIAVGGEGLLTADIAGFHLSREALAKEATPIRVTPAWVCEVLGGGSRSFTRTTKRRAYGELGVAYLWIADPDARVLEVFQNQRGKWLLVTALSEETRISAPPFEDLHFDASDLWLPLPRRSVPPPSPSSPKRSRDAGEHDH